MIVVIMRRLHEDDLVGHLMRQRGWRVLFFPAIAEVDETHASSIRWNADEGLHPEVRGVKPDGNKIMRLHAQATIENGFVQLPTSPTGSPNSYMS